LKTAECLRDRAFLLHWRLYQRNPTDFGPHPAAPILVLFLVSLGPVARVFVSWWGVALLLGVVGPGIVAPLLVESDRGGAPRQLVRSASLVLLGGFLLRMVVLLSSGEIHVVGSGVTGP
jgi:hypothetical protein